MTDEQLISHLEFCAKAVGIIVYGAQYDDEGVFQHLLVNRVDGIDVAWNPWVDGGQALHLAVALGLTLELDGFGLDSGPCVNVEHASSKKRGLSRLLHERHNDDPLQAARQAIVRSGAIVGQAMA